MNMQEESLALPAGALRRRVERVLAGPMFA